MSDKIKIGKIRIKDKESDIFLEKYPGTYNITFTLKTQLPKELVDMFTDALGFQFSYGWFSDDEYWFNTKVDNLKKVMNWLGKKINLKLFEVPIGEIEFLEKEKVIEEIIARYV